MGTLLVFSTAIFALTLFGYFHKKYGWILRRINDGAWLLLIYAAWTLSFAAG